MYQQKVLNINNNMTIPQEKVLLSPKSLQENNLKPNEATLGRVIDLLMLPSSHRTVKQISILQALTKKIKFFIEKIEELGEAMHLDSCKSMTYEFIPAGEFVFKFGEHGKKFYIILEGSVKVIAHIPNGDKFNLVTVAQMNSGMAFGEWALIKNLPRSASIQCNVDTHFAVLIKDDYMRVIGRAEARMMDTMVDFLYSIPFFQKWSKRKLSNLTYYCVLKKFIRKQVVFTCGSPAKYVYIVKSGEFEITKPLILNENSQKDKNFNIKISLLGKGEIFCEDEVLSNMPNKVNCACYSTIGELYCISAENFKLKFQKEYESNEEKERKIKYLIREKRLNHFQQYLKSKDLLNDNDPSFHETSTQIVKKNKKRMQSETCARKLLPLKKSEIKRIKTKALGTHRSRKTYINFNTPFETLKTEENYTSISPREDTEKIETNVHIHGTFYRARVKKGKSLSRKFDNFHNKSNFV